jgi:glutamate carboxypeptidase
MKSGLLAGLYAIKSIVAERGGVPFERLVFVANPDEEVGSPTSTPHIQALAADVDVALVLECARANGDIVSGPEGDRRPADRRQRPRRARGRRAREGSQRDPRGGPDRRGPPRPQRPWPGVTVNVGVIGGGTRPNVVAERARSTSTSARRPRRPDRRGGDAPDRRARRRCPTRPSTSRT